MKVEVVYPLLSPRTRQRAAVIAWAKWPFLAAACASVIVNLALGGLAWSPVVLWSGWILWSFTLAPGLVEVNRISLFVKFVVDAVILLVLIGLLLSPGWAGRVIPIVSCGALITVGVLFFTDLERQRQNMLPMLVLTLLSGGLGVAGLTIWQAPLVWPLIVLTATAAVLIIALIVLLGRAMLQEVHKRFHW